MIWQVCNLRHSIQTAPSRAAHDSKLPDLLTVKKQLYVSNEMTVLAVRQSHTRQHQKR